MTTKSGSGKSSKRTLLGIVTSTAAGAVAATIMVGFSMWFPFVLFPKAAKKTYLIAYYVYDPELSHFDNTVWTYGTDYALGVIMVSWAAAILSYSKPGVSRTMCIRSASLLLLYAVSVFAGGYCHQNYTTLESRNSFSFYALWTLCVGSVSVASTPMGMSASEAIEKFQGYSSSSPSSPSYSPGYLRRVVVLPKSFWFAFGTVIAIFCAVGGMSFHRPACDIFIAGITQSVSTFFQMTFFFLVQHPNVTIAARVAGSIGFILNAPLLPLYPVMVQYSGWSLAGVNTLLHCWLCVAWSLQGYSLLHVCSVMADTMTTRSTAAAKQQKQKIGKVH